MGLTHTELRNKYKKFWEDRGHKEIPAAPIALTSGDSTTLFTSSGMQQLVPYLLGEEHPLGDKLFDIQPSIRTQDIEEVGDNRHTTFFEMMGNWSLGAYFKKDQLENFFLFLTDKTIGLGLDPHKLFVTVFEGDKRFKALRSPDTESQQIWTDIFAKAGIDVNKPQRIYAYPASKNWWSRGGLPAQMPVGEPGGPDSEVFYDFGEDLKLHEQSVFKDEPCHPNCDCGRFLEIGNSVFMQYKKTDEKTFEELPKKNVDFGGGLERILAATNDDPDIFKTDVFNKVMKSIERNSDKKYDATTQIPMRIIADHLRAATFLIKEGVRPSNKEQGYVLRRLLRRAAIQLRDLGVDYKGTAAPDICHAVMETYPTHFVEGNNKTISDVIKDEVSKFAKTIEKGIHALNKLSAVSGKDAFDLYQSYGFPLEIIEELVVKKGLHIDKEQFYAEFEKHKNLSRTSSAGMFKGGLADNSEQVLKYHTATHLLHQALFDVLGTDVKQEGSNITGERLRFDFSASHKPSPEEMKKVEEIINQKINDKLPMRFKIMPKSDAEKIGARSFFKEKYPDMVKVYYIGGDDDKPETAYSKEFCGGPHVTNTGTIGTLSIFKTEKIGSNMYRVYAK